MHWRPTHYLMHSEQLCWSMGQAVSCTVSLHVAYWVLSHHTHTHTQEAGEWVHDWFSLSPSLSLWKVRLNSFVDLWIKYAEHMRPMLLPTHWFLYAQQRFQFISAKTNICTLGERWCRALCARMPVSVIDGCAADRANLTACSCLWRQGMMRESVLVGGWVVGTSISVSLLSLLFLLGSIKPTGDWSLKRTATL